LLANPDFRRDRNPAIIPTQPGQNSTIDLNPVITLKQFVLFLQRVP